MYRNQDFPGALRLAIIAVGVVVFNAPDVLAQSNVRADFNGDGFSDLAVGVIEDAGSVVAVGAVHVLYGSADGLTAADDELWTQDTPGIEDVAEDRDLFGSSLAAGDFDADGFADLAIGVPSEDFGPEGDEGAVNVVYGSASGLSPAGNQLWHQDRAGIKDVSEGGDYWGQDVAAGDFNGDGFADLAVGAFGENGSTGSVSVLYGSAVGVTAHGNQFWTQDSPGIVGEVGGLFGAALGAGDFNADGFADLAVGVPAASVGEVGDAGAVNVLYGSESGLSPAGNQLWHQDRGGIADLAESGDAFGEALGVGDFNGDGFADLIVGAPLESEKEYAVGRVNALYGSPTGLSAAGNQLWHQDQAGIQEASEGSDIFGAALAVGDFDGDGFADAAIAVPHENPGGRGEGEQGAVNVLYGSADGLSATENQFWTQDSPGIVGEAEFFEQFGSAVGAADFNGDGFTDLAIGVINDGSGNYLGAVNVLYGSAAGLGPFGNQLWHQDRGGIEDEREDSDQFGWALVP